MKRPLLLLALAGVGCGGRAVGPQDGGGSDLDASADGGADADAGDALPRVFCDDGFDLCPREQPYCCGYEVHECGREPFEDPHWEGQWECAENPAPDALIDSDCAELGVFRPEDCPQDFPHCCLFDRRPVCVDHLLVGWLCDR